MVKPQNGFSIMEPDDQDAVADQPPEVRPSQSDGPAASAMGGAPETDSAPQPAMDSSIVGAGAASGEAGARSSTGEPGNAQEGTGAAAGSVAADSESAAPGGEGGARAGEGGAAASPFPQGGLERKGHHGGVAERMQGLRHRVAGGPMTSEHGVCVCVRACVRVRVVRVHASAYCFTMPLLPLTAGSHLSVASRHASILPHNASPPLHCITP